MATLERILLVAKNKLLSKKIKSTLHAENKWNDVYIEVIPDLDKTLKELSVKDFHLLLIDCQALKLSAVESLIHIRALKKDIPLILMNKPGRETTAVTCLKNGANYYLSKTGRWLEQLPIIIESVLEESAMTRARKHKYGLMEAELKRLKAEEAFDESTHFYSIDHFKSILVRELNRASRHGLNLTCLVLNMDEKAKNKIEETATLLKSVVRGSDVWARLGDQRFAALLPHTNKSQANFAINRITAELKNQIPYPVKWGLAEFGKNIKDESEFLAKASKLHPVEFYAH